MTYDPLRQNPSAPTLDGAAGRSQGPRMAQSASTRCGRVGALDRHSGRAEAANEWPGKTCGIRAPEPFETPLSYAEVAHFVRMA